MSIEPYKYYPLLIKDILEYGVSRSPNKEIVYKDFRYTWKNMYERVNRLANALTELGVGEGDVIGVLDFDTHRYLELYYGVPMIGAVLHTINLRLSPEWILYTVKHAEDKVLVVRDEFLPLIESAKALLPESIKLFIVGSDKGKMPSTSLEPSYEYDSLLKNASPEYDFPMMNENTRATIMYTTGTTGLPKGVSFTHRQIVLHAFSILAGLSAYPAEVNINSRDILMPLVPFFHVHSWGVPYVAGLLGIKTVLLGRYELENPERIFEVMKREKVTFTYSVPTILHVLVSNPKAEDYKDTLSKLKIIIGGAALPRGLAEKARSLGIKVMGAYGLSETCPALTLACYKDYMLDWPENKKFNISIIAGFPFPLVKLRVVDENMNNVPRDWSTMGEIVVRAPWLTYEYLKDPEKTEGLWRGGWMHTGDIAKWDDEGYILIGGRTKFVIKSGGEWIPHLLIEDILSTHPAVSEVAIVGVPSEKWSERPIALVVPNPEYKDKLPSEEEYRDYLMKYVSEGKLAKWWLPDKYIHINEIPKTSVGKTDYNTLWNKYKSMKLP